MPFLKVRIHNVKKGLMKLSNNFLFDVPYALKTYPRPAEKYLGIFKDQKIIDFLVDKRIKLQRMIAHPLRMGLGRSKYYRRETNKRMIRV